MLYYELVKIMISIPSLTEVIINMIVHHHGFLESIVMDRGSLFISKFWSLLCYFLEIKRKLSTAFYPQTNVQIKRQNNITSKRPPRERELLGNQAKKSSLVKRFLLHFWANLLQKWKSVHVTYHCQVRFLFKIMIKFELGVTNLI